MTRAKNKQDLSKKVRTKLSVNPLEQRDVPAALVISEIFTNPSGSDSPYEYVKLVATRNINFATENYSVVFASLGTANANGWVAGGSLTYGFNITSGSVTAGQVVAVGGSSLAAPVTKLRTINTATTAGDGFGASSSLGVLGNGGTSADGVAVFAGNIQSLTSSTVPVDAVFFGSGVGGAAISSGGFRLPANDLYNGGTVNSNSFVAPNPGTDQIIRATGTFSTATNSFSTKRTFSLTSTHTAGTGITISGGTGGGTSGDAYEVNNTIATASNLGSLSGSKAITGLSIHNSTDKDYFKFTTAATGSTTDKVRIDLGAGAGDLDLYLYDSAGTQIGSSAGTGNVEEISLHGRAAGTYTIGIVGYNGATGNYSLTVSAPTGSGGSGTNAWTIFVYITASDLHSFAHADINEMEFAVSQLPSNVKVVAFWDQSNALTKYSTGNGTQAAWGTAGRAIITADTNMSKVATTFEILPEQNTGNPTTLVNFLTWGASVAPASNYSLMMWNHGSGLQGSNYDDSDGTTMDYLSVQEFSAALATPGVPQIKVGGYDACLMAMAEIGWQLRSTMNVFVGSEELEGGNGHDYRTLFNVLKNNPASVTPEQLASGYVVSFGNQYVGTGVKEDTYSASRSSNFDNLAASIKAFVTATDTATTADLNALGIARTNAVRYDTADFKDLASFMRNVQNNTAISSHIRTAAGNVLTALSNTIISKTNDHRNSGGLSIYMPSGSASAFYTNTYSAWNTATNWSTFINRIAGRGTSSGGSGSTGGRADRVVTPTITWTGEAPKAVVVNPPTVTKPSVSDRAAALLSKLSNIEQGKPVAPTTSTSSFIPSVDDLLGRDEDALAGIASII